MFSDSPECSGHFQRVLHGDNVQASHTGSTGWTSAGPNDTFGDFLKQNI